MADVSLSGLSKLYPGGVRAVDGIDLDIGVGEFLVLVGPSGCGKSTTLRMIAGLDEISAGEIRIGGVVVNQMAPRERDIAMVFQNYALYPHMTVFENMAFGLQLRRVAQAEIARRVEEAARMLDISALLQRRPRQLSGGQRQRVAMGRALVRQPRLFLFDEPLSNLDARLRVQMRTEMKRLHQLVPTTTVYVTHDQVEAMTLADRVVVMNRGRIEQVGAPQEVYHAPASRFVAEFIGAPAMNFLPVRLAEGALVLAGGVRLALPPSRAARYAGRAGEMVLGIRPEHLTLELGRPGVREMGLGIDVVEPMGAETLVHGALAGVAICAKLGGDARVRPGDVLPIGIDLERMHLFDAGSGVAV